MFQEVGGTILKVGIAVLLSSLANQHLRNETDDGLKTISKQIRKAKLSYRERFNLGEAN